jgi:hypothetical protein
VNVSERRSGLLVAEQAAVPRQIRDALKRLDSSLVLGCEVDTRHQCYVWRVLVRQGDQPARWLFDWREQLDDPRSHPRPLSYAIVEEAASRRLDSRRPQIDPVKANEEMEERLDREDEEIHHDIAREVEKRAGRISVYPRSQALRRARDRGRRKGQNL